MKDGELEPSHFHHDFRYIFVAKDRTLNHQIEEITDAKWFKVDDLKTKNVQRIIEKAKLVIISVSGL